MIDYRLNPRCRRLSMTIDERGLRVGAPRTIKIADIEQFIRQHGDWVLDKLMQMATRHRAQHLLIREGVTVPVLGQAVRVCVEPSRINRVRWREGRLELYAKADADLQTLTRRALQKQAQSTFMMRLAHYAGQAQLPVPALRLSSARTRWGSCSRHSGIRLNWRLIHLPLALIDYVVAHELSHYFEMNHSPRFWSQVEKLYPNWQGARESLKREGAQLPFI
jgi:predicted metal-dependent hydrolase